MQYIDVDAIGARISRLGLGTWAIGGPWKRGWGAQDESESIAAIRYAVEHGVNWIDTAAVYGSGHSERMVAEAVSTFSEADRPLVMTKCGRIERDDAVLTIGAPESIRAEVDASLTRLRVERIDVMQLHWPPADVTLSESWATLAELKAAGKIRHIGLCNVNVEQLDEAISVAPVDLVQNPLSLINRSSQNGVLDRCSDAGVGVIVYSPMQSGLLTGKYDSTSIAALDETDWRRTDPEFTEPRLTQNLQILDRLRVVADRHQVSVSECAIAWTLHQRGVSGAIVGARRPSQVSGWLGSSEIALNAADLAFLEGN